MPSVAEVADQLTAAALPVIFLDTCILLDVIRAVKRGQPMHIESAAKLLEAASTPPASCAMVVSHLVHHEWGANHQGLLDEAKKQLAEVQDQSRDFHIACDILGITRGFTRARYAGLGLAEGMHDLSKRLLDAATVIDADNECSGRAIDRVTFNIPPSKRGGEAKDCVILEEYLAVCRALKTANFSPTLVFCTSNTTDYRDRSHRLHTNIDADFKAVGLRFAANLPWGFHEVTH